MDILGLLIVTLVVTGVVVAICVGYGQRLGRRAAAQVPVDDPGDAGDGTEDWQVFGDSAQTRAVLSVEPEVRVVQVDVSVRESARGGADVVVTRTVSKPPPRDLVGSLDDVLRSFAAGEIVKAVWPPATES